MFFGWCKINPRVGRKGGRERGGRERDGAGERERERERERVREGVRETDSTTAVSLVLLFTYNNIVYMANDPMFHETSVVHVMVLFQMAHSTVPNHLDCHSDVPLCVNDSS